MVRIERLDNDTLPSFLMVRQNILVDYYYMIDTYNSYRRIIKTNSYAEGFDKWTGYITSLYLQLRGQLKETIQTVKKHDKESYYFFVVSIMEDFVTGKKKFLTYDEAVQLTLDLSQFVYDLELTKISKEKRNPNTVMEKLR